MDSKSAPKLAPKLHTLFDREESRRIEKIVEAEMAAEKSGSMYQERFRSGKEAGKV